MSDWRQWAAPVAAIVAAVPAAHATQYLTISQASQQAFPGASFVAAHVQLQTGQKQHVWKAMSGSQVIGYVYFDQVIGKHLYIDYAVVVEPGGRVRRVEILEYRESYGGEVRGANWLSQFVGKTQASPVALEKDIRNISGATLSARHIAEGVKKVLSVHAAYFR